VDYIGTEPWNDPYNLWPTANSVYISAVNIAPVVRKLYSFNPNGPADFITYKNSPLGDSFNYVYSVDGFYWTLAKGLPSLDYDYVLKTTTRQLPTKYAGLSGDWYSRFGYSTDAEVASLAIIPVWSDVTPWEKRRRRLLELN